MAHTFVMECQHVLATGTTYHAALRNAARACAAAGNVFDPDHHDITIRSATRSAYREVRKRGHLGAVIFDRKLDKYRLLTTR